MNFAGVTVLCLGDIMLDRFVHGTIERISPEAPIPVLHLTRTQEMLGGNGNVAHNIAALGGRALLVGLVGADAAAGTIRRLAGGTAGILPHLVETALRPTICKSRFIASQQQVVRTDEESRLPLQPAEEEALLAMLAQCLPAVSAVILSDYGKGVLSPAVIARAIALARERGIPVTVDPKAEDFGRYRGATCITPNTQELARASGMPVDSDAAVEAAARRVMADAQTAAILATRSERGMMLVMEGGPTRSVPARAREVFDVSGAGDTVIAALTLAHASGLPLPQAMTVANAAAGVVVSKFGTATATVEEVLHEMEGRDGAGPEVLLGLRSMAAAQALVARWRGQGLRVGFISGRFDAIDAVQVARLKAARATCDRLVVGLHTGAAEDHAARAQVLAAIVYVDCVVGCAVDGADAVQALAPDLLPGGAEPG